MGDPLPDITTTMVVPHDFMGGIDGNAAGGAANQPAIVIGIGGADRQEGKRDDKCEEGQGFFHGGFWITPHSTMQAPPYSKHCNFIMKRPPSAAV